MSRAMNVAATPAQITALCARHDTAISAIEPLLSGGTRVVMMNGDDAATMRRVFGKKILDGAVTRSLFVRTA